MAQDRMGPGCISRLALIVVGVLIVSTIAFVLLPGFRPLVRTVALVPELLDLPLRPLSLLVPEPRRTTTSYGSPPDRLDLYLPHDLTDTDRRPAVVLALGVHPPPLDDPQVTRLATSISRLGVVVAVPDSTSLRETRILPTEPARLAGAVMVTAAQPGVDPLRIGLAGFSAGASVALIAAADPRVAADIRFVSAFGGYADAELLLIDVATRTTVIDGADRAWSPDPGIRGDVLELVVGAVEPPPVRPRLRALLAPVVSGESAPRGPDPAIAAELDADARAVYLLFTAAGRASAESAAATLSPALRRHLAEISPSLHLAGIQAPVFLLHGDGDRAISIAHSIAIADGLPDWTLARFTRFGRFEHGQPGADGLGPEDASDVWELTLYLHAVVAAATE